MAGVLWTTSHAGASPETRDSGDQADIVAPGWWLSPIEQATLSVRAIYESDRPYSTTQRPRDIAGSLALSCASREGQPCGNGAGGFTELDSHGGYGSAIDLFTRLRVVAGTARYEPDLALARIRLSSTYGPLTADIGRDVLRFGPSAHVQLGWGTNAPPVDRLHVFTRRPLRLADDVNVEGDYALARLRAPQTFPGNLVSIVHGQIDIDNVKLGVIQLLQLGGEGAPEIGFWDFVAEHVRRRDSTAGATDSSNRRFGGDVSVQVPSLANARFYYQLIFEDIRKARFIDAVRYDADHLLGVEIDNRLTVEWQQTGVRSQEHAQRTTGFTNAGFAVGSPLGPDAKSFFVGCRSNIAPVSIAPWLELAALSSDRYEFIPYGPINRIQGGPTEMRYRAGSDASVTLGAHVTLEIGAFFERVTTFRFVPGSDRNNAGLSATLTWSPGRVWRASTR